MSRPRDSSLPYLPGIDALRAVAVLAVFLYHAGVDWLPGGFLGVDVFFVISGYLITSLLLAERRASGRLDLARFWLRRARRLLPAVGVLVAVTMIAAAILDPGQIDRLRVDALASLAYVANWHFVLADVPYFEQFQRPSLFTHLWSLAVEEQFYLLWPLVFAAGMATLGRQRLLVGVLAGAAASVALAWLLFVPGGDASRVYYGTDTHAVGLLAGVALALFWGPAELRRRAIGERHPLLGPGLDALGAVALAYLVLCFLRVHDYDLALWHGGYAWLALATALLIAALAHPAARLGRLLGCAPLVWLGLRSYSFYLWHWPVLALSRPGVDVALPRGILIPLQLLAVLGLAELSYRFVERPFRAPADPVRGRAWLRTARPVLMAGSLALVLMIGWSGLFATSSQRSQAAAPQPPQVTIQATPSQRPAGAAKWKPPGKDSAPSKRPGGTARWGSLGGDSAAGPPLGNPHPAQPPPPRIIALGDSVMVGAAKPLAKRLGPRFSMSAEEGRQPYEFVAIAKRLRREGHHPDALIIHMGNNGALYGDEMAALQKATVGVGHLFLVNDHAPVSWAGKSNQALAEAADDWPHTTLVDWRDAAESRPGLLWDDIHLTPKGARVYARTITEAVRAEVRGLSAPRPPRRSGAPAHSHPLRGGGGRP